MRTHGPHLQPPSVQLRGAGPRGHRQVSRGRPSTEEILDRYVVEYGEKVLSAPTTSGFNILAWWGPYIALGLGCGALLLAFRRWRHVAGETPLATAKSAEAKSLNSQDRDRLARELEDLDA